MKNFAILLFTFILFTNPILAQKTKVQYFNKNFEQIKSKKQAYRIRKIEKISGNLFKVTDSDKKGNVLMIGEYSSLKPLVEDGEFKFYSQSSKSPKVNGQYENGKMVGKWIYKANTSNKLILDFDFDIREIKEEVKEKKTRLLSSLEKDEKENTTYTIVEQMPQYANGGEAEFLKYISNNVQYPALPHHLNIEERVYISYEVNVDGSVINLRAVREGNKDLIREGMRVLSQTKWVPGTQDGKPVIVTFTMPLNFQLE